MTDLTPADKELCERLQWWRDWTRRLGLPLLTAQGHSLDDDLRDATTRLEALSASRQARDNEVIELVAELINCGNAIVGASMNDEDADEAFEMWDKARQRGRAAIRKLKETGV